MSNDDIHAVRSADANPINQLVRELEEQCSTKAIPNGWTDFHKRIFRDRWTKQTGLHPFSFSDDRVPLSSILIAFVENPDISVRSKENLLDLACNCLNKGGEYRAFDLSWGPSAFQDIMVLSSTVCASLYIERLGEGPEQNPTPRNIKENGRLLRLVKELFFAAWDALLKFQPDLRSLKTTLAYKSILENAISYMALRPLNAVRSQKDSGALVQYYSYHAIQYVKRYYQMRDTSPFGSERNPELIQLPVYRDNLSVFSNPFLTLLDGPALTLLPFLRQLTSLDQLSSIANIEATLLKRMNTIDFLKEYEFDSDVINAIDKLCLSDRGVRRTFRADKVTRQHEQFAKYLRVDSLESVKTLADGQNNVKATNQRLCASSPEISIEEFMRKAKTTQDFNVLVVYLPSVAEVMRQNHEG